MRPESVALYLSYAFHVYATLEQWHFIRCWSSLIYCVPVSEVPGRQHLPDVINCQFREFTMQHFRDPCNICRRTNSLEFTA